MLERHLGGFAAWLVLLPVVAAPAHSIGVFTADTSSILTITAFLDDSGAPIPRPPDLVIEGQASIFDEFESALGNAVTQVGSQAEVVAADDTNLGVGDALSLGAMAAGDAAAPTPSTSEASSRTDGLIFLDNRSFTETFRVAFELVTAFSVDAALDDAALEQARAEIQVTLDSLSGGLLFDLQQRSDPASGAPPAAGTDSFALTLILGPRQFDELSLINDATGHARALTEPSVLLAYGLALVIAARRRRKP